MSKTPLCDEAEFEVHEIDMAPRGTYPADSIVRGVDAALARTLEIDAERYRKIRRGKCGIIAGKCICEGEVDFELTEEMLDRAVDEAEEA